MLGSYLLSWSLFLVSSFYLKVSNVQNFIVMKILVLRLLLSFAHAFLGARLEMERGLWNVLFVGLLLLLFALARARLRQRGRGPFHGPQVGELYSLVWVERLIRV